MSTKRVMSPDRVPTASREGGTELLKQHGCGLAPFGGLKVLARSGWFAARPSVTENIYKIYAESFQSPAHLNAILSEARQIVNNALGSVARS